MVMWPLVFYRSWYGTSAIAIVYALAVYLYVRRLIRPYLLGRQALREVYRREWFRRARRKREEA